MQVVSAFVAAGVLVTLGTACSPGAESARADGSKVATVADRVITRAELEEHVRPKLIELETQRYEVLREGLDELIEEELERREAKARGISTEELERQEILAKAPEPGQPEVQKLFDDNKAQLGGQTFEQIKPRIVEYLKQQGAAERREAFIGELKAKYKTTVALRPPVVEVATAGRPEKGGGAKAPVTIITFSDYECPFCKRAELVVDQVMAAYGEKVRLVFRDYPLPMHRNARAAAEAAACAHAQGKFWDYHAKLFANQTALGEDKLKEYAKEIGLDGAKFEQCLAEKPYTAAIDKDIEDASKVGVTGTPAFFINGRMLSGAQPFEKFKEVIDEELAARGVSAS